MTPLSSMVLVTIGSFIGSFGAVFLKSGAARLQWNLRALVTNWRLALGVIIFLTSSVFFMFGLRQGELSVLYPLVSVGYIWTLLWSRLFFGEPFTKTKFVGIGMILAGVALVGFGTPKKASAASPVAIETPR